MNLINLIANLQYLRQGETDQRCRKTQLTSDNTKEIDNRA